MATAVAAPSGERPELLDLPLGEQPPGLALEVITGGTWGSLEGASQLSAFQMLGAEVAGILQILGPHCPVLPLSCVQWVAPQAGLACPENPPRPRRPGPLGPIEIPEPAQHSPREAERAPVWSTQQLQEKLGKPRVLPTGLGGGSRAHAIAVWGLRMLLRPSHLPTEAQRTRASATAGCTTVVGVTMLLGP